VGGNGGQQPHIDNHPAIMKFAFFHIALLLIPIERTFNMFLQSEAFYASWRQLTDFMA
jgi:hypothetical protein